MRSSIQASLFFTTGEGAGERVSIGPGHCGEPCVAEVEGEHRVMLLGEVSRYGEEGEGRGGCEDEGRGVMVGEGVGGTVEGADEAMFEIGAWERAEARPVGGG